MHLRCFEKPLKEGRQRTNLAGVPLHSQRTASKSKRFPQTNCRQVAHHCSTGGDRLHRPQRYYEAVSFLCLWGCAVLFNKDTFHSEIEANSIYLHDTRRESHDQAAEGGQGWVMSGVLARATFKWKAANGQKHFTVLCLHICNIFAKKRGIAKKLILAIRTIMTSHQVDPVAGDFNGTAWRSTSKGNYSRSTIEEAFSDCNLPTPPGPTPLWRPGSIPNLWTEVCGFLKPPESHQTWKIRKSHVKHWALAIKIGAVTIRPVVNPEPDDVSDEDFTATNPSSPSAGPPPLAEQRGRCRREERSRSRERVPLHSFPNASQQPQPAVPPFGIQQTQTLATQGSDEDSALVDPHNRVSDRSRSPQEREGSRRQGPQTQKGKKTITENQPSDLPSAKKHKSMDADEDDQEPQNEPGTSSTAQLTEPVLPLHQVPAASFQKTSCNCNT